MSSKETHTNICDDLGIPGNTLSSKTVARNASADSHSRIAVNGDTKDATCSSPAVATSSGLRPTHSGLATWRRHVWIGKVQPRRRSRVRARDHGLKRSCLRKEPLPTSTTNLARWETPFRLKLSSERYLRSRTRVTLYKETPRTRLPVARQWQPHLGYQLPPVG